MMPPTSPGMPTRPSAAIWLKKSGEDFLVGARLRDGRPSSRRRNAGRLLQLVVLQSDGTDVEYFGPTNGFALPSPAAILSRDGPQTIRMRNHRNQLAKLLGVSLDKGDDVFLLAPADPAKCGG